jgi:hypothetical protein
MSVLSRFLEGFRVYSRERFWRVFIEFRCFPLQFWSYGCFESVLERFRSVVRGSGWSSEVLEGFHGFSLLFRPILELWVFWVRFRKVPECVKGFWMVLRGFGGFP